MEAGKTVETVETEETGEVQESAESEEEKMVAVGGQEGMEDSKGTVGSGVAEAALTAAHMVRIHTHHRLRDKEHIPCPRCRSHPDTPT